MKLGTKTRYSARAMVDLALKYSNGNGVVPAQEISTRQQVSPKYLEHLLAWLRSAGLVSVLVQREMEDRPFPIRH